MAVWEVTVQLWGLSVCKSECCVSAVQTLTHHKVWLAVGVLLWVGIHFGSMLYLCRTHLSKLPVMKIFLSCLSLRLGCAFPEKKKLKREELPWPGMGGTNLEWGMVMFLHMFCICESPLIQNMTRAKEQKKMLSKITWDKDLGNLLFILLKSPWRLLLLREEM